MTKVKTVKNIHVSEYIDVEIEIGKKDVIKYLKKCSPEQFAEVQKGIKEGGKGKLKYKAGSIMEDLALAELKEVLHWKGAEHIMQVLKGGTS